MDKEADYTCCRPRRRGISCCCGSRSWTAAAAAARRRLPYRCRRLQSAVLSTVH